MSFIWVARQDDELQWRWDEAGVWTDDFRRVHPQRLPRGVETGRIATRATVGNQWTITSGASWVEGDLLRLNDPDNDDVDLRELSDTSETVIGVASHGVTSGGLVAPELHDYLGRYATVWNVRGKDRFHTTDVNGTTPTAAHVGQQASLDNSDGWQLDLTGSGAVEITRVETVRGWFVVKFLDAAIQANPGE